MATATSAPALELLVANLPIQTTDEELSQLFWEFGEVTSARVILDRETGRSKGYGYVEMPDADEAYIAIQALDGSASGIGRPVAVSESKSRTNTSPRNQNSRP
ncbi:RNA-binding protein [Nitratireductor mangrovi]|uniref:RNA-binding protein n=1 Tax=Nitratireductor mangrovi TaxID=2599600 RepID=A0A5B8L5T7_9HYPH|nr:RNA-binding protein [Nitratireductor mangrovi]